MYIYNFEMVKNLLINSRNRLITSNSTTDFTINLSESIKVTKYIRLQNFIMPNTQYLINNNINNTFTIDFASTADVNVTLNEGNYDTNTFCAAINNLALVSDPNFLMSYDDLTYRFKIVANLNFTLIFTSEIYKIFGYFTNANVSSNANLLYSNIVNMQGSNYFLINLQQIENTIISSSESINYNYFIMNNVARTQILNYYNLNGENINYVNGNININQLKVQIYNDQNKIVDLNGSDNVTLFFIYE